MSPASKSSNDVRRRFAQSRTALATVFPPDRLGALIRGECRLQPICKAGPLYHIRYLVSAITDFMTRRSFTVLGLPQVGPLFHVFSHTCPTLFVRPQVFFVQMPRQPQSAWGCGYSSIANTHPEIQGRQEIASEESHASMQDSQSRIKSHHRQTGRMLCLSRRSAG